LARSESPTGPLRRAPNSCVSLPSLHVPNALPSKVSPGARVMMLIAPPSVFLP
jgi:hypothetical protein